jgi:hypothetical protein
MHFRASHLPACLPALSSGMRSYIKFDVVLHIYLYACFGFRPVLWLPIFNFRVVVVCV